jgi:hypothetical protein
VFTLGRTGQIGRACACPSLHPETSPDAQCPRRERDIPNLIAMRRLIELDRGWTIER